MTRGIPYEHIRAGYRALHVKHYLIFYLRKKQSLEIIRVLHENMDVTACHEAILASNGHAMTQDLFVWTDKATGLGRDALRYRCLQMRKTRYVADGSPFHGGTRTRKIYQAFPGAPNKIPKVHSPARAMKQPKGRPCALY